jgi:carbonic anhydrase
MMNAKEALDRLREGNQRFVAGALRNSSVTTHQERAALVAGQSPFAIVLGCSDSRVPVEMVFDQGLGDLFVIRVAGNVVSPSQVGSVEFAAATFGTPLVVVLGHSSCGAVTATFEELRRPAENQSPNLRAIVERITPAVASLLETELKDRPKELIAKGVRANVRASAHGLRHGSRILEDLIAAGKLLVVGAEYDLETGAVDFFDGVPAS